MGILLSSGIFVFTPVEDRESKLRYLLNFAGMRSSSYYIGLLLADIVIFMIPQIILAILFFILKIEVIQIHFWMFWGSMFAFGWAMISFIYMINFMFDQSEHSFKYSVTTIIAIHLVPLFLLALFDLFRTGIGEFVLGSLPLFVYGE